MDFKKLFKKKSIFDYLTYLLVVAAGIAIDRVTKILAVKYLMPPEGHSVPIIKDVLHLTYLENDGAAWGILDNAPWVFNTVSVIMVVAITLYLALGHASSPAYGIALSMIVSGGVGNLIDRFGKGYVVDFIDFTLIDFPVFNGADCFVVIGAGMLILLLIIDIINEARNKKGARGGEEK